MNYSLKNEKMFEEKVAFQSQSDEENTMRILQEIANSIDNMIQFTVDHPSKHQDNKLPVLDLKVSVNTSNVVDYEFYEKPTKNPHVVLASSALGMRQKRNIFVSEALRRLRNTSQGLGPDVQNKHLTEFMLKLKESGYDSKFRAEIILSAKSAYSIQLENDRKGIKPLYRERHQIIADKKFQNQTKSNWWKKKGGEKYTSVLFVPPTPGGELAKLIQAREAQLNSDSGTRIKVVEGKGTKLKDFLIRKNPFGTQECQKQFCPLCKKTPHSDPGSLHKNRTPCETANVGYSIICLNCKAKNILTTYEGETGRLACVRTSEHIMDLNKNKKESPLVKHKILHHKGEQNVKFSFKISGVFKDPLTRQCNEGVRIKNAGQVSKIMNSKSERNHPPTNRIIIQKSFKKHVKNGRINNSHLISSFHHQK